MSWKLRMFNFLLLAYVYIFWSLDQHKVTAQVNFNIPPSTVVGDNFLIARCAPNDDTATVTSVINEIRLSRRTRKKWSSGSSQRNVDYYFNEVDIVAVKFDNITTELSFSWYDLEIERRASVRGDILLPRDSFLRLMINNVDCTDEGYYTCKIFIDGDPTPLIRTRYAAVEVPPSSSKPLTSAVYSGNIRITGSTFTPEDGVTPFNFTRTNEFSVDTGLIVRCSAAVGYPASGLQWCIKRPSDEDFFDMTYNSVNILTSGDIRQESCIFSRTSYLFFDISDFDNGTELMCKVDSIPACEGEFREDWVSRMTITLTQQTNRVPDIVNNDQSDQIPSKNDYMQSLIPGILLSVFGLVSICLAAFVYIKARTLKIEYEKKTERERYQDLHFHNIGNQGTYQEMNTAENNGEAVYATTDEEGYVAMA